MLDELSVHNLGLIEEAHIDPGVGLVVITGETGAGKTLLLGALRLLRGEQARKDQIGPAGGETAVEARMLINGDEHVVRRTIAAGRSRAYIDGAMVTAAEIAGGYAGRIDIVGQHDRNALAEPSAVRELVDGSLDRPGRKALAGYEDGWQRLKEIEGKLALLGGDRRALEREVEVVRFQASEITDAGFATGDDEQLQQQANRLRNAEALGERLASAAAALGDDGAGSALDTAWRELSVAARTDPSLESLVDLAAQAVEVTGQLSAEVAGVADDFERDPARLDQLERRLALLGDLRRKYGDSLEAVLAFGEAASVRAAELTAALGDAGELEAAREQATRQLAEASRALHAAREKAAGRLAKGARAHLSDLGFTEPVVSFAIEAVDPGPNGADRIVLEFSSDASLQPKPASRIASGGELSRLTLALRLAAGVEEATVVAFDEIDAGTGGTTALAMGRKLAALADGRQVFCVTHLPQVAAFADRHFAVRRDGNAVSVERVDGEGRVEELSRMLAGLPESERGKEHAAELLSLAGGR